mmetsp:Transcript_20496/g.78572  ORF Transcript_20496/g.78572 Transcript_20496/m.78572 type:complete len:200 (+) Transcript_20496:756-1355(+)
MSVPSSWTVSALMMASVARWTARLHSRTLAEAAMIASASLGFVRMISSSSWMASVVRTLACNSASASSLSSVRAATPLLLLAWMALSFVSSFSVAVSAVWSLFMAASSSLPRISFIVPLDSMISSGRAEGLPLFEASFRLPSAERTALTALSNLRSISFWRSICCCWRMPWRWFSSSSALRAFCSACWESCCMRAMACS